VTYTWRVVRKRRNDSAFQQLFSDFVSNKKELLTGDITFFLCTWQTIYELSMALMFSLVLQ